MARCFYIVYLYFTFIFDAFVTNYKCRPSNTGVMKDDFLELGNILSAESDLYLSSEHLNSDTQPAGLGLESSTVCLGLALHLTK